MAWLDLRPEADALSRVAHRMQWRATVACHWLLLPVALAGACACVQAAHAHASTAAACRAPRALGKRAPPARAASLNKVEHRASGRSQALAARSRAPTQPLRTHSRLALGHVDPWPARSWPRAAPCGCAWLHHEGAGSSRGRGCWLRSARPCPKSAGWRWEARKFLAGRQLLAQAQQQWFALLVPQIRYLQGIGAQGKAVGPNHTDTPKQTQARCSQRAHSGAPWPAHTRSAAGGPPVLQARLQLVPAFRDG